jgi:hypothetical protein
VSGARKRAARFPTDGAAFRHRAPVADCAAAGKARTVTAAGPRTAGRLSPLPRADEGRGTSLIAVRRVVAFGPVQTRGEVAERGLLGFDVRLPRCCPLHPLLVLRSPIVRLPGERDSGLFRQYHGLEGTGRRTLPVDRRKLRGGSYVQQGTFHVLLETSLCWKMLGSLKADVG